jgi:hypothetical protein
VLTDRARFATCWLQRSGYATFDRSYDINFVASATPPSSETSGSLAHPHFPDLVAYLKLPGVLSDLARCESA